MRMFDRTKRWLGALLATTALVGATFAATAASADDAAATASKLAKIGHIIVIYEENRSFDTMFGNFPGAEGLSSKYPAQVDPNGRPYKQLPPIINNNLSPPVIDTRFPPNAQFPQTLANKPFRLNDYIPIGEKIGDLVHRYYQEQVQIDAGKMDRFAVVSDAGGLVMGINDLRYGDATDKTKKTPAFLWTLAANFTLLDHFFHPAFGGSFLNHQWLVCGCTPTFPAAPTSVTAVIDNKGNLVTDGAVTPDGYAVNTIRSVYLHAPSNTNTATLLPPQTQTNIGDLLDNAGVTWAWYAGGYDAAVAGTPDPLFQFHHQPFAYFASNAPLNINAANAVAGTPLTEAHRTEHLKDFNKLYAAIDNNTLEQVVWYKPIGELNMHPGYTDIASGDEHLKELITHIRKSPIWDDTVVIITFDEHGGTWDHVAPTYKPGTGLSDQWGPGSRVPGIIVSPFAQKGIDHRPMDQTAILKLIEDRFQLPRLGARDAAQPDMWKALN